MKHGIFYGFRPLHNGFGIYVAVYKRGRWIETDLNRTPWPNAKIAMERAHRAAESYRDNREPGLPVHMADHCAA